jgi:hypothetical protein
MPLSAIVSATGALTVPLLQKNGKPNGKATISLVAEEQQGNNDVVHFECHGVKLAALDFFGSSDPILVIHRAAADGSWVKVFETEAIKNNVNPRDANSGGPGGRPAPLGLTIP